MGGASEGGSDSLEAVAQSVTQYQLRPVPEISRDNYAASNTTKLAKRQLQRIADELGIDVPVWPGRGPITNVIIHIAGGRTRALEYIALAVADRHPTAQAWWRVFGQLRPSHQEYVTFDNVCAAAGVPPSKFLGMLVEVGCDHESMVTDLAVNSLTPKLVHRTFKSAMRIGGQYAKIAQRDRHALLQGKQVIPVPRNAAVNVNVNASANANSKAAAIAANEPSVPSFLEDVGSLQGAKESVVRQITGEVVEDE